MVQAKLTELAQTVHRVTTGQQFEHFIKQTRIGHVADEVGHRFDRFARRGLNRAVQFDGEPHGPQHAHGIFTVARSRVADHAHRAVLEVFDTTMEINDDFGQRLVIKRVDREVASHGILLVRAEFVIAQDAAVVVRFLGFQRRCPEGRRFDDLGAKHNMHQLESPPDNARAPEQGPYLFRGGVGRNVEILGL